MYELILQMDINTFRDSAGVRSSVVHGGPITRFFSRDYLPADVYSLNVPVPSEVARLAGEMARHLPGAAERSRGRHTLVAKRLGTGGYETYHAMEARVREFLTGQPAFEASVTGIDMFPEATSGTSPVVYLVVESPGLWEMHERLCEEFGALEGLEGDDYDPHVTIARGGSMASARRLCDREIEPVEWTVDALSFLDAERGHEAGRISLPA